MSTIRILSSGKWNAQIRLAGRKPRSRSFNSKEEAENWANKLENKLRNLTLPAPKHQPSWEEMALQYSSEMLMGKPSQVQFLYKVGVISRSPFMKKPFHLISSKDINSHKIHRLKKVCSTTVHGELVLIRRIYLWADREAQAAGKKPISNPCSLVTLPKPRKPRDKVIEKYELDILMAAISKRIAPIVELAYETAMRRTEIVKLQAKHLYLDQRLLSVIDGKEGDRTVPLTKRAVEILQEALDGCYCADSRLFPVAPHSVSTAFRRARRKAGLSEDVRFHQLRHTRCTIIARRGFNQAQMMVVTGHKDIRSVQRYTHLNAIDVVKLLD